MKNSKGSRVQPYHRHVMAILLYKDFPLLLDIEMQRQGEDEVAAATRPVERIFLNYPRVFDVVVAEWMWVTTISQKVIPTRMFVDIGHGRWDIENKAFNELVTHWHADHV